MPSPAWRERMLPTSHHGRSARARFSSSLRMLPIVILLTGVMTTVKLACCDDVNPGATSTTPLLLPTPTTTSTTTTTITAGLVNSTCSGMTRCLNHTQCARCLSAINATPSFVHTNAEYYDMTLSQTRAYFVGFFETLQSTASCSTHATPPEILRPALLDLGASSCTDAYKMATGSCIVAEYVTEVDIREYTCFASPGCRPHLTAVYSSDEKHSKAEAIRSLVARTATIGRKLINDLAGNCPASFPVCSFHKQKCGNSSECLQCLTTFGTGDGDGAARQCCGRTRSAVLLDNVVDECTASDSVTCSFWIQRCTDNVNCNACLAVLGSGQGALAAAADWSTPACQIALLHPYARNYIESIMVQCPAISLCRQAVAQCAFHYGDACLSCINGSAPPSQASFCSALQLLHRSFGTPCQPCPEAVHTTTVLVMITAVVGAASATVCVAVAATIVAHEDSRVAMRHRIVIGLMLSNAVYSTANVIPLNALRSDITSCGQLAMSFGSIRFGRAWWFCGKYAIVSFELFILGASIRALFRGSSAVPVWTEAAMHVACWTCACVAFAVFYSLCFDINTHGYNANTENEAITGAYNHGSLSDDLDDDAPSYAASLEFVHGRDQYDSLVRDMLVAWNALVGVAVVLWVVLRLMYLHALRILHTHAIAAERAESADPWAHTRRSAWAARRRLLEARKDAFNEVAKPLEPYIAVFVVFAAPAILMSTSFCQAHSGAISTNGASNQLNAIGTDFRYGTCDVWCEFVLAFRSLATVAVYLQPRERRVELVAIRTTWRKLVSRAIECVCCRPIEHSPFALVQSYMNHDGTYEMLEFTQESTPTDHDYDHDADNGEATAADASTWRIKECDVVKAHRLGRGAFGDVWEGTLLSKGHKVAIKTILAGAVDEDGDLVDPAADEDFCRECASLQAIHSPHLIKFFGFGTTKTGNRFIVTELMGGGSLEDVLHNRECDLPWRTRVSFGLQIALGMDHLHQRHMLHRDLKSANVLVNEQHTIVKVCDFGLSRVVKPTPPHIVSYSPFTGVARLLPRVDSVEISNGHDVLSLSDIAVGIEDARGNMTKAVGTMMWMAPEVFRGDQNYTSAVDVYSFGVVLWELATRETPWREFRGSKTKTELFEQLNRALQTGQRPNIPFDVSRNHGAFVAVMSRCWAGDAADRPTFSEAARDVAALLRSNMLEQ